MGLIADILLIAGALGAAVYCLVLARKVSRLTSLESGMGSAIAVLSAEVDGMTRALSAAQTAANTSSERLGSLTVRAEETSKRLELLLASMHDLDDAVRPAPPRGSMDHRGDIDTEESGDLQGKEDGARFLTRRTRLERPVQ
jgi:outer membrane murein-binding lipoprotein Lpp